MLRKIIHTAFGILLLVLMILVPTDLLRIGLNSIMKGDAFSLSMEMEIESDIDYEDKEESKEKHKKKNKITFDSSEFNIILSSTNYHGSATEIEAMSHPLAHHLEVSTPPPEVT